MQVDPEEVERIYRSFPESLRRRCLRRSKPEVWLSYDDPDLLDAAIELEDRLNALAREEFQSARQAEQGGPPRGSSLGAARMGDSET
jgi:hypothetical protein